MKIQQIELSQLNEVIETRELKGLFYSLDTHVYTGESIYVGVDNRKGEAYTEDFTNLEQCILWLKGEI